MSAPAPDGRLTGPPNVAPTVTGNRSLDEFAGPRPADEAGAADDADAAEEQPATDHVAGTAENGDAPAAPATEAAGDRDDAGSLDRDGDGSDAAAADDPTVDSIASTYAWSPEGAECAACGATVEERWRDGDDLVCPDCKAW